MTVGEISSPCDPLSPLAVVPGPLVVDRPPPGPCDLPGLAPPDEPLGVVHSTRDHSVDQEGLKYFLVASTALEEG